MKTLGNLSNFLLVLIIVFGMGYNVSFLKHGVSLNEKLVLDINASQFANAFSENIPMASKKYLFKAISIRGYITKVNEDNFIIDNILSVHYNSSKITSLKKGDYIEVNGKCLKYDVLTTMIKFDKPVIRKE